MVNLLITVIYVAAAVGLLLYSLNCYVLVALYLKTCKHAQNENLGIIWKAEKIFLKPKKLPIVTTQIPLFNEFNVAERCMRAASEIEYPKDKHQIQILDDSTDETRHLIDRIAGELKRSGHWIEVIRRTNRTGFKAGALADAMDSVQGEYIAIFDADFVPPKHFFRHALPFFLRDPKIGLVQARWGHLNRKDSPLTRAQAIGIDGHFMIEQTARAFTGLFMNFNGTAGLWRRTAIVEAGGWSADTLTEDLDLAYRAQLGRWKMRFISHLEAPGELPTSITAFKSQQFRWAKGSIQTACKLLPRILKSDRSWWMKFQAVIHLTHYLIHPLILIQAVLALPMLLIPHDTIPPAVTGLVIFAMVVSWFAPSLLYWVSQRALYPQWWKEMRWMPALMCVGIGLAISNTCAVYQALTGKKTDFVPPPNQRSDPPKQSNT